MTFPMPGIPAAPVSAMAAVDQARELVVGELGGEVAGQHVALGPLGFRLVGAPAASKAWRPPCASSPRG